MAVGVHRGSLFFWSTLLDAATSPAVGCRISAPSLAQQLSQLLRIGDGRLAPEPTANHGCGCLRPRQSRKCLRQGRGKILRCHFTVTKLEHGLAKRDGSKRGAVEAVGFLAAANYHHLRVRLGKHNRGEDRKSVV